MGVCYEGLGWVSWEDKVFEVSGCLVGGDVVAMLGVCIACPRLLADYHGLPRSYHVVGGVAW